MVQEMALVPSAALRSMDRKREREEIHRRLVAFDEALDDLRQAKERLQKAADLYLERLEGTKKRRADRTP